MKRGQLCPPYRHRISGCTPKTSGEVDTRLRCMFIFIHWGQNIHIHPSIIRSNWIQFCLLWILQILRFWRETRWSRLIASTLSISLISLIPVDFYLCFLISFGIFVVYPVFSLSTIWSCLAGLQLYYCKTENPLKLHTADWHLTSRPSWPTKVWSLHWPYFQWHGLPQPT